MALFLQKTVLDVDMSFMVATMKKPIKLNQGTGISAILKVSVPDNIEIEKTATGDISSAIMPVIVTGTITLHPQSPALQLLQQTNNSYIQTGLIVPGILNISSAANNWSYSYTNVVITSPFKGYDFSKTIDDYEFTFKADLPDVTSFYNLVNSATGFVAAV